MKKKIEFAKVSLEELAAIISEKLKEHGIQSILVGGACVTIYSENLYQSYDLDFITYDDMKKITKILEELDFKKTGKHFTHPECQYFVEFVSPPVSIGNEPVRNFEFHSTAVGMIKMLTPTDSVKDRLASFYHWNDSQSLDQAIAIYKTIPEKINLNEIRRWSEAEKFSHKFEIFLKKLNDLNA